VTFALLGCPRSGTNLLSSLLKHSDGNTFLVEPFAMNVPWVLSDDLYRLPANELLLRCRCNSCYTCELRDACQRDVVSFKETSLFEYLDVLAEDFGVEKIVYLERQRDQVVESYMKHELWTSWRLEERRLSRELSQQVLDADSAAQARAYGELATDLKRTYWQRYKSNFNVFELAFDELMNRPVETVWSVFDFLGRKPMPYLDALIERKFREGESKHAYATFPHDHR
jgi:hypothetical protein